MTQVRAIHTVMRNPYGRVEPTGKTDEQGRPRTVAKHDTHAPGDTFEIDDAVELEWLLAQGAVEIATEGSAL